MPSTYSTSLGLELIGNGEQAGTWGTTTNSNLGTLIEQAIAGVESITLTGGDYTLTDYNGLPDQARNAVLVFGGLLAAPCNVIAPAVEKTYIVRNFSNATVTVKTSGGNGVAIANAASEVIFCDGTNFYSATQFNYIDGNLTVSGTATANNLVATNNITLGKDLFGNASTGQVYLPVGTQAQRAASPINGLIRYNTTDQIYEGYQNNVWIRFVTAPQGNYTINYLIISGGAGGATNGGGGAGGYISNSLVVTPTVTYTITVGGGGAASTGGTASSITGVATGAGGGTGGIINTPTGGAGSAGGSGGGGGGGYNAGDPGGAGGSATQGNSGGSGGSQNTGYGTGGGGGGSGAVGGGGVFDGAAGAGGAGTVNAITGIAVTYAGGGGGGGSNYYSSTGGAGGSGGGGAGGNSGAAGVNGTAYTGGGGGGGASGQSGGNGGSGVVILSMPTVNYSGNTTGVPTVTTSGANTILKYTNSGSYTT